MTQDERLPLSTIWFYSLPSIGFGAVGMPIALYLMKYSTDVLLIAPATMGTLFFMSRLWDGVSDPMAGYLSDRTVSPLGRRRSWMLFAALPTACGIMMLWLPPISLTGAALVAWMVLALFVYETASTAFHIPHGALGAELSPSYHERTRIFGYKHVIGSLGLVLGIGAFWALDNADNPRDVVAPLLVPGCAFLIATIGVSVWKLRERAEYQGRGAKSPFKSIRDVARNPHARLLLAVHAVETFGTSSIMLLLPYMTQYVLDLPGSTAWIILSYIVPQFALTPLWIRVARRIGKKRLWLMAMVATSGGFLALFFIEDGTSPLVWIVPPIIGAAGGCGAVASPAINADIVDYDELETGERKEGAYLAAWNLIRKSAAAFPALLTGIVLQVADFQPNQEQSEGTKLVMRGIFGLVPAASYAVGALLFARFQFNEHEHEKVRRVLDQRRRDRDQS